MLCMHEEMRVLMHGSKYDQSSKGDVKSQDVVVMSWKSNILMSLQRRTTETTQS